MRCRPRVHIDHALRARQRAALPRAARAGRAPRLVPSDHHLRCPQRPRERPGFLQGSQGPLLRQVRATPGRCCRSMLLLPWEACFACWEHGSAGAGAVLGLPVRRMHLGARPWGAHGLALWGPHPLRGDSCARAPLPPRVGHCK